MVQASDSGDSVLALLPRPGGALSLHGIYLRHELYRLGQPGRPFVYTNFVSSLDGRISWKNPATGYREVPPACASRHDLRLYNELTANADLVIASSRYLRGAAAGRAAGMLSLGEDAAELVAWRRQRGLADYPRVAVVSNSLRLPERARLGAELGDILVLCCGEPDRQRRAQLEGQGYRVLRCGPEAGLDGGALIDALKGESCRSIYSVAGPRVHAALLRAGRLDRLYLTMAQVLLGGADFDTLVAGDSLAPAQRLALAELYHDPNQAGGAAQLFAVLDRLD